MEIGHVNRNRVGRRSGILKNLPGGSRSPFLAWCSPAIEHLRHSPMPHLTPPRVTALLVSLLLAGCASQPRITRNRLPEMWRMDTPMVRQFQEQETAKHFPQLSNQKHLRDTLGACVEVLYENPDKDHSGSGRAVAISPDGYYLTADHVISGSDSLPFLVEHIPPAAEAAAPIAATRKSYPGRLVWNDPGLDLAILKFDRPSAHYMEKMRLRLNADDVVYSGDESGWSLPIIVKEDELRKNNYAVDLSEILKRRVGNGAFFSAGKVVSSRRTAAEAESRHHRLTLVARGGMSGSPLVTDDNELCGIIIAGELRRDLLRWPPLQSRTPYSYATMIDPAFIQAKIKEDRTTRSVASRPEEAAKPANKSS